MDLLFHPITIDPLFHRLEYQILEKGFFLFLVYCVPRARTVPGTQGALSKGAMHG